MSKGRVLSIQSHVAFGYVGGKAAVFPLQCLDYDVDVINTVNFSNHSGYRRFGGPRANATELNQIFDMMEKNKLLQPERLLTGYIPGGEALSAVLETAHKLKERDPSLIYLLDPVLGDSGKLYVSSDVIPIYRAMLPLSTIITPNWFELETLTDVKMTGLASLQRAIRILHEEHRVPNVVISSIPLKQWLKDGLPSAPSVYLEDPDTELLLCIASFANIPQAGVPSVVHTRAVPCIPGYFSGVGDLFSALVLAHYDPPPYAHLTNGVVQETPISRAVSYALKKTHALLTLTHEHAKALPEDERLPTDDELDAKDPERVVKRMRGRELRLIQGQDIIRSSERLDAEKMDMWSHFWKL